MNDRSYLNFFYSLFLKLYFNNNHDFSWLFFSFLFVMKDKNNDYFDLIVIFWRGSWSFIVIWIDRFYYLYRAIKYMRLRSRIEIINVIVRSIKIDEDIYISYSILFIFAIDFSEVFVFILLISLILRSWCTFCDLCFCFCVLVLETIIMFKNLYTSLRHSIV